MSNQKIYQYVGSKEIKKSVANYSIGKPIKSRLDLENWIKDTQQKPDRFGYITVTFIIDLEGYLRIADRHSEHIACSGGKPVLSAGEILFIWEKDRYEIAEISNQSTGFCPEIKSWHSVSSALDRIPLSHPDRFTLEFEFRLCNGCNQINIVKGDRFICDVCNQCLSLEWNF